ncbi:MAG: hypothetical protein JXR51_08280 [Bacteroidales bacterium]|nr:hypothetical protein [Bacteroidales bacterium]MBN2757158.1 hypothetical protein [Bacteroidales bacterium]
MNENKKHIEDIAEIRNLMEKSSKFISLSGLSGILAGVFALIGSITSYWYINISYPKLSNPIFLKSLSIENESKILLILLAFLIFILAFGTAVYFTTKNRKNKSSKLWNYSSKKVVGNLFIPLSIGAIFISYLILNNYCELIVPSSLIFYGLSLINAGHFTFSDIKYLGLLELITGCFSLIFIDYYLLFWSIGFGALHIIYGILMYIKYERK